jgi:iron complex outermembrane receptor protein
MINRHFPSSFGWHAAWMRILSGTLFGVLALAVTVRAQAPLPDLSLEDLMKLDAGHVFGASQRIQPVTEAPSSVSFVTAEDIRRYGYRTLADILRSFRGIYVTDDRNFSLLGAQGFAKPGDYNSRILLLINGHRVNDNVFGQAEIGAEFGMDPATFERVEFIRGPASSLYGDSAFFGVVNVITRNGSSLGGGSVNVEGGSLGTRLVRTSYGRVFESGLDIAVSGTYSESEGLRRIYFPAFDSPLTNNGIAENLDGEGTRQFYSRLAFKGLTVTAAYGTRKKDVPTASFGTAFNGQSWRQQTTDRHTLIDAEYGRSIGRTEITFRGSFDRFSYDGYYPFDSGIPDEPIVGKQSVLGDRLTLASGLTRALRGRQTIRAGVEFIENLNQDQMGRYVGDADPVMDKPRTSTQHAVYFEDEIKFSRFILNAGLRYDSYGSFSKVTPRTAFIFMPSSIQSFKYLYGRAFRAPNSYELNDFYFGQSVENLRPEVIDTHQLVWERYTNDWMRTSVSGYWYKADRLITPIPDMNAVLATTYINQAEVRAHGLEFETQMRLRRGWQALASYAVQKAIDQETRAELPNSPRHIVKTRLSVPGPVEQSFVSIEGQYLSTRKTLYDSRVGKAATVNLNLVQPIGHSWELYAGVRNIFDSEYLDPASSTHRQEAIPQNGRTFRFGLQLKLWPN